mmetsp:Transcript_5498/g.8606  ORF Transcript_5498/g.8606 Transcript_5498/m.8606 type:complete len:270 (+) Transcript_5498:425-1234(+)
MGRPMPSKPMKQGIGRFMRNHNPDVRISMEVDEDEDDIYEYIGQFKNDMRHGLLGICFFKNGDFYAGGWRRDKMDTSQQETRDCFREAVQIKNDGLERYVGEFRENLRHGRGILYNEDFFESGKLWKIQVFKGSFVHNEKDGEGYLQVMEFSEFPCDQPSVRYFKQVRHNGNLHQREIVLKSDLTSIFDLLYPAQISEEGPLEGHDVMEEKQKQNGRLGLTCLEELDTMTKINEYVHKYPRIDLDWSASKQVAQWLFDIHMPPRVIEKF